jgi:hypothetical protein
MNAPLSGAVNALGVVTDAVLAALKGAPGLSTLNRVGTGEGERAPVPHAWIAEAALGDWGAKAPEGAEVAVMVALADRGDAARLAALCAAAIGALRDLPRPLDGWDHAGPRVRRGRSVQRRDGMRVVTLEVRVRVLALA